MAHECPSSQASSIQLKRFPKVDDSLEMFSHKRVIIANNTAGLRHILIVVKLLQSQISQFSLILLNVQDIGIGIHVLEPVGIDLQ